MRWATGLSFCWAAWLLSEFFEANKRQGLSAFAYQALAWVFYCIALFAKQSSFSIPLIVVLLFLLRPGDTALVPLRRRIGNALLALIAYSIPAAIVFFHAKALLQYQTPYPISITLNGLLQWLSYIPWYFVGVDFPYLLNVPYKISRSSDPVGGCRFCCTSTADAR